MAKPTIFSIKSKCDSISSSRGASFGESSLCRVIVQGSFSIMHAKMTAESFWSDLNSHIPRFEISSSQIEILDKPSQFHDVFLAKIGAARRRIFLCSLFLETRSFHIRKALNSALRANTNLRVLILLDKLSSTRPDKNHEKLSTTPLDALVPMLHEFGDRIEIRLYHTPSLRGWRKRLIPKPFDEGFGLQHIKIYGFDNTIIMTGANIAERYFTNQQDRYYVINAKSLADYLYNFVSTLRGFCYRLSETPEYLQGPDWEHGSCHVEWPGDNYVSGPLEQSTYHEIQQASQRAFQFLIWKAETMNLRNAQPSEVHDTVVYPLFQLAPLLGRYPFPAQSQFPAQGSTHQWLLARLISVFSFCSSWTMTTSYIAFPNWLRRALIVQAGSSRGTIITTAPEALFVTGEKGLAGLLPRTFMKELEKLVIAIRQCAVQDNLRVLLWRRGTAHEPGGWTFHAKGSWVRGLRPPAAMTVCDKVHCNDFANDQFTDLTVIGSSNYAGRCFTLDLEFDLMISTVSPELRNRMAAEERRILSSCHDVTARDIADNGWSEKVIVTVLLWIISLFGLSL